MKADILKVIVFALLAICTISFTSCHSSKKTVTERVIILDDHEAPLTNWIKCSSCSGKGECNRCKGTGKIGGKKCDTCAGTGKCSICNGEGGYRSR